jgi:tripartite-type tricarboxylate transporter receptor subunit TctC
MVNLKRITTLIVVACACAWASLPAFAEYPAKPVKIVVPYPPGGTTDILARFIAAQLGIKLKQPFVVENRAGASGAIGSQAVANAAPDGHTLLMATISTHGINSGLSKTLPYDPVKDFVPITVVGTTPNIIAVNPALPVKNLAELLALAKSKPGTLNFGSTSPGGSPHMSGELLKALANVDIVHVPYKGGGPMLTDLIGGQIQIGFDNLPSSIGFIRAGKIRALAVTTPKRWPGAPEIPTVADSGVPGYDVSAWFGLLAPANTPKPVINQLHKTVAEILAQPNAVQRLLELGAEPGGNTPEEFARQITDEVAKWKKVVTTNGLKVE